MSRAQLTELFGQAAMAKDDVASEGIFNDKGITGRR